MVLTLEHRQGDRNLLQDFVEWNSHEKKSSPPPNENADHCTMATLTACQRNNYAISWTMSSTKNHYKRLLETSSSRLKNIYNLKIKDNLKIWCTGNYKVRGFKQNSRNKNKYWSYKRELDKALIYKSSSKGDLKIKCDFNNYLTHAK